ncbi:hypothetical protein V1506DRAFT_547175, partial [Lipomyces tetrasporus]
FRKRKLSPTLVRNSIGIGKGSDNFWREFTRELTFSEGLDLSSVSGSYRSIESNSWFSILVYQQKSTRPPNSRRPSCRQGGGNKVRAWKIRLFPLFPTTSQKETLRQWFGTQRYIYNRSVALVREGMKQYRRNCVLFY